jgi:hypothetical protein
VPFARQERSNRSRSHTTAQPLGKSSGESLTVGRLVDFLAPSLGAGRAPYWPPDAFALAAGLLQKSDAYPRVVTQWPPRGSRAWLKDIEQVGRAWRSRASRRGKPPRRVENWWGDVISARDVRLRDLGVRRHRKTVESLLELCAAADEASAGAGIMSLEGLDAFERRCFDLLSRDLPGGDSLCDEVDSSCIGVLPKLHTPQCGMTLRSLSHHLALVERRDVIAKWPRWPFRPREPQRLNLLLLPWPLHLEPHEFAPCRGRLETMPEDQGFFTMVVKGRVIARAAKEALQTAERIIGRPVDAIVFPEMALRPGESGQLCSELDRAVIGGASSPAGDRKAGINQIEMAFPTFGTVVSQEQSKHHRWKLTPDQVSQYALGQILDGRTDWWEYIELGERKLEFHSIDDWLTFCVLICEDLARQDPVAEVVRSVGPDLVIALLLDGPQLTHRWPARYAGVLADDPGSSVLTLTSLGMTVLSSASGWPESRVVAMWKDAKRAAHELPLFQGAWGMVLSIKAEDRTEYTADGRTDQRTSSYLSLEQVHQVYPEPSAPPRKRRPRRSAARATT